MSGLHHWYRFQYLWVLIKQRIINFFPLQPAQGPYGAGAGIYPTFGRFWRTR